MQLWLRRAAVVFVALGLPLSATVAAPGNHRPSPSANTTLPCVDVTVHVTQPPPGVHFCPLAPKSR